MTYLYEQLTPERFQHFCQALLASQFPNAQCLPVGQPDGGRDAYVWTTRTATGEPPELIVFQVKFSRDSEKADAEFIQTIVNTELPKVDRLKEKGITAYYLLTNVSGTAHLDVGSVDKVHKALSDALDIPAYCWWRNDLDRRVDNQADIKWSYPEIIRGSDLLQALLEGSLGEDGRRRDSALKAYLASQFDDDREVKFKQVDLTHNLLDLFVDTSLKSTHLDEKIQRSFAVHRSPQGWSYFEEEEQLAARFFLHRTLHGDYLRAVLEGAPGQGKSTITQYVCQVHRMRLLDKNLNRIPSSHLDGLVRFPMRVDLRDFANWLGGKNPYAADPKATRPTDSQNSLESFLAFQIGQTSGGHSFSVSDLAAFAKLSHLLIVLDGFDEVADIPTREQIVREISRSAIRLDTASRSLQIIVTSRPAAFAKSPGFSRRDWSHLSLQSMDFEQIYEYAEKWMTARYLSAQEKTDFRDVLRQKLDQPHMRDLARNPMQLAILLSLIQTRGLSLPDKRTALYDSYMELFFSREAEKSAVVREHRDLLVDLHQFLAWVIQTEAEEAKSKGSITEDQLKAFLREYLKRQGHETSLVDDLFVGMVERVVALVSRVQGTFEFEVQPLREYFAARYLYDTAPYSPPGQEKRGTKPERFDVLARNFYWLNVTRFYCGCYSRGELSSLADGLIELSKDENYRYTSFPHLLVLMLLGDWVFTQQPMVISRLIADIVQEPGLKILLATLSREPSSTSLVPPERCGRAEILKECTQAILRSKSADVILALAYSIRDAASQTEMNQLWMTLKGKMTSERWLYLGRVLGQISVIDGLTLNNLFVEYGSQLIREACFANRFDFIESRTEAFKYAVDSILAGNAPRLKALGQEGDSLPYISFLAMTLDVENYNSIFTRNSPYSRRAFVNGLPFRDTLRYRRHGEPAAFSNSEQLRGRIDDNLLDRCDRFLKIFSRVAEVKAAQWGTSLKPWSDLVSAGMKEFGFKAVFLDLALLAAGINSKTETGAIGRGLNDGSIPLCDRIRYARLRSGSTSWWSQQLADAADDDESLLVLTSLLVWGTPRTILASAEVISPQLEKLTVPQWDQLVTRIERSSRQDKFSFDKPPSTRLAKFSPRFCIALALRVPHEVSGKIIAYLTRKYHGTDRRILRFCLETSFTEAFTTPSKWKDVLPLARAAYRLGINAPSSPRGGPDDPNQMPIAVAKEICQSARDYPLSLVHAAQSQLTKYAGSRARAPGAAARTDGWFAST